MKLTLDRIVDAGMATFAEVGYDGLSMRRVAERLGAQAGSLYYHVPSKEALLRLCADRVAQQAYGAGTAALAGLPPGAGWRDRVLVQVVALRTSIRDSRGGAVLLAASPKLLSPGALSVMERLLQTLADAGVPASDQRVAADSLLSYVTGFVLQEQSESPVLPTSAEEVAVLASRFPMVMAGSDDEESELFVRSVRLLCSGIATAIEATRDG